MGFLEFVGYSVLASIIAWMIILATITVFPVLIWIQLKKTNKILELVQSEIQFSSYWTRIYQIKSLEKLSEIKINLDAIKPLPASRVIFYSVVDGKRTEVKMKFMKIGEKAELPVVFLDALDNVAKVDGIPQWGVVGPELGVLTVADDGMSATFLPSMVGVCKIQVKADADLNPNATAEDGSQTGVKTIIGECELDISAGEAVKVVIDAKIVPA